jgi:hypothetical protein
MPNRPSTVGRPNGIERPTLDARVIVGGGLLSGALGLGLALLLRSRADTGSGVGPTAAALNDAFSQLYGAAIGLAVGTAIVAFAVQRSRRFVSGLFAGLLGYAIILAPALIISAPSDVSTGESISIAAFAAILLAPAVLLGAVVGALVAERRVSRRRIV